jgi:hypothetical protein
MTQLLEAPATEEVSVAIDFDELLRITKPVKPKLSEAIRAGSRLTDPTRCTWFEPSQEDQPVPRACAMGAACYVANGETNPGHLTLGLAAEWFPELLVRTWLTPEQAPELFAFYGDRPGNAEKVLRDNHWCLGEYIAILNDSVALSRERIADIVEALGY